MFKYYVEEDLTDFPAWGGGENTLKALKIMEGAIDIVDSYLKDVTYNGGTWLSIIDINDFLWFEREFIFCELLGLSEEEMNNLFSKAKGEY